MDRYIVIATKVTGPGQEMSVTRTYSNKQYAEQFVEIIKQLKYTNIKLVKEHTIQEVLQEWN